MYTKHTSLFDASSVFYARDNSELGYKRNGELKLSPVTLWKLHGKTAGISMTRAQAYRYWFKKFPERPSYMLPAILQKAIEIQPEDEDRVCVIIKSQKDYFYWYRP